MAPKEKKELVGCLKKETNQIIRASLLGLVAGIILFIIPAFTGKNTDSKKYRDKAISGKIFLIALSEKGKENTVLPFRYQLRFKEDMLYPKIVGSENKQVSFPSGFSPGYYTHMVDSSDVPMTALFASKSKKRNGATLLWQGTITGNTIQGIMHWSEKGKANKVFSFSGILKYINSSDGKF
jgi:hypothetical protein